MAKKIVIVDDSVTVRQMTKFTLHDAGYDVVEAVDGQDAFTKLQNESGVDLIITDLNMPNMNGIELISNTRSLREYIGTPIIMLTSESDDTIKNEGKKAGATGWIVKPFKPEQLISVVKRVLGED